jgi:hypothetical protein
MSYALSDRSRLDADPLVPKLELWNERKLELGNEVTSARRTRENRSTGCGGIVSWSVWTGAALAVLIWMLIERPDWVQSALGLLCLGFLTAGLLSVLWRCIAVAGSSRPCTTLNALVLIKDSKIRVRVGQ